MNKIIRRMSALASKMGLIKKVMANRSIATENLNKSEELVTILPQHQSTYLRDPDSASMEIPLSDLNLLSKSTSKCERCEVRFTS